MSFLPPSCFASINIILMVLPLSSNENLKQLLIMESSDSDESDRVEVQASQDSNSASVTVEPTGVTGPRVIKFGYKEFTVKCQRWHAACRSCDKRIQDKVNVTSAFTK